MKIYYAGSIRGGDNGLSIHAQVIAFLTSFGEVLTEHIGFVDSQTSVDYTLRDTQIYERDMDWISQADVVIADVSIPSLGVGYEIRTAELLEKPVVCLFNTLSEKKLSAMITGIVGLPIVYYTDLESLKPQIADFFAQLTESKKQK